MVATNLIRFLLRRKLLVSTCALLLLVCVVNLVAYRHARAMTRFVATGTRTNSPERLSTWQKISVLLTGVTVPRPANGVTPEDLRIPFSTHRFASTDGIQLEAWHIPSADAPPRGMILLFHGYAGCKSDGVRDAAALRALRFNTLLVDFRASGGSTGDETTIGYREADDVASAVRFARQKFAPSRIVLMGDSMGAVAVLRAASLDPNLADALIITSPFDRLLSTVENRFHSMAVPSFPFARLMVFWGGARQGYWAFSHNPIDYAANVQCRVLHLHGGRDPRVTLSQAQALFDRLAEPKKFVCFPTAGHESCSSADLNTWTRELSGFLDEATGVSAAAQPRERAGQAAQTHP